MAYCTESDLEKEIPPANLTDLADDNGDGTRDAGVIARAIADADGEIDAYLATRYTVPLSTVPNLVRKLSVDIALWNLYSRKDIRPELRRQRYEDALGLLKRISTGVATLGIATEPPTAASAGGQFSANTRVFTRDKLKKF